MDNVERIDEMRKINFNLDKRLNDYNKNVTELKNQLESGNLDPREFQKSMEHLIKRRMEIAAGRSAPRRRQTEDFRSVSRAGAAVARRDR